MNNMIYHGTTPHFTFTLPFESDQLQVFSLCFAQDNLPIIQKNLSDCICSGYTVSCTLRQVECFAFSDRSPLQLQVRMKDRDGNAYASNVFRFRVMPLINKNKEVI